MPMLEYFLERRVHVYLPVMLPKQRGQMDFYSIETTRCLQPNKWGVLEPEVKPVRIEPPKVDLMVVPALAFHQTPTGVIQRLGRGGGYYDIFFEKYIESYGKLPYTLGIGF